MLSAADLVRTAAEGVCDVDDLIAALPPVADTLRRLGVRHYVGGSFASAFQGAIRSTVAALGERGRMGVPIATTEDSILRKLEWFRTGDETSEQQWDDAKKIVAVLGESLDVEHMRRMAASIGVGDLVDTLLPER